MEPKKTSFYSLLNMKPFFAVKLFRRLLIYILVTNPLSKRSTLSLTYFYIEDNVLS
jgi:hypothetical protein